MTGIILARVFSSSTNWHLLFKVHECTGEISRGRFEVNLLGKFPWNVVEMKEEKAAFLSVVELTLWLCCLCEKSTIILVEIFSDMCCLEDNTSCKCQTECLDPFNGDWLRSLVVRRKHANKVCNFHFSCLV